MKPLPLASSPNSKVRIVLVGEPGDDVGVAGDGGGIAGLVGGRIDDSEVEPRAHPPDHAAVAGAVGVIDLEDHVLARWEMMMLPSAVPCSALVCSQSLACKLADGTSAALRTCIAIGCGAIDVLVREGVPCPHQLQIVVQDQYHVAEISIGLVGVPPCALVEITFLMPSRPMLPSGRFLTSWELNAVIVG